MINSNNLNRFIEYALPLTAALIICRAFPVLSFFYYAVPFILLCTFIFYLTLTLTPNFNLHPTFTGASEDRTTGRPNLYLNLFTRNKHLKTLLLLIALFGMWASITAFWSPFPKVSLSRAAYFFLITIPPVLLGYLWSKNERNELFAFLLPANFIIVMVSLYSLITSAPANAWTGGHGLGFMGYAGHQNTLAAAIVFTVPSVLFPLLKEITERLKNKDKSIIIKTRLTFSIFLIPPVLWLRRAGFILIFILNLYLLILSVSRAGVITLIIMLLVFILLSFNKKTTLLLIFLIISAFAISFVSSQTVREFVFKTEETIGDRRIVNIRETIEAAKNGGFFGLGYGISQPPSNDRVIGHYENNGKLFVREKMIGMLALVEEVGVIGLAFFLAVIGYVFLLLLKTFKTVTLSLSKGIQSFNHAHKLLLSVIVAFCSHAQFEAWWVGVGSVQLPLFFMVIGLGFGRMALVGNRQ